MNIFSSKIYKLKCENNTYSEGDVLNSIEWYDGDYDRNRREENVRIEQIGENLIQISNDKNGCLTDIWICEIIDIE